jgi:protein ImuA
VQTARADIFKTLQADVLRFQGVKAINNDELDNCLGPIASAFPNHSFPLGVIHELISHRQEEVAATNGFVTGLLSTIMGANGTSLWISSSRCVFPIALKNFYVDPDRFIFLDLKNEKDVIWAMDEALKCGAVSAVVGELSEIDFKTSRRLQLNVERSGVTGFIVRNNSRKPGTTASVSRWKISSLPSEKNDKIPGIGFPKWRVELSRIRNGKPGTWDVKWFDGKFLPARISSNDITLGLHHLHKKKAG